MDDPALRVLGQLLEASHDLAPDELVAAVAQACRAMDADDVAVYLADYEQTLLVPLADGADRTPLARRSMTGCGCGAAGWPPWSPRCS